MSERRKVLSGGKPQPLPIDYLRMVDEVLNNNFGALLGPYAERVGSPTRLTATGSLYPDEIVLAATLTAQGQVAATTVHASTDYDPQASSPDVQDLLAASLDAIGGVWDLLLAHPDTLEALSAGSLLALSELETATKRGIPLEWQAMEVAKREVWLKVDKTHPALEDAAAAWLAQHDPAYQDATQTDHDESEETLEERLSRLGTGGTGRRGPGGALDS